MMNSKQKQKGKYGFNGKITSILITSFILIFLQISCSARFVKREELKKLNKKWGGDRIYILKKDVNIGNGRIMQAGTKVRVWFESNTFSVKMKAYLINESREKAYGRNLIYLCEGDFQNEEYSRKVLEKVIKDIVKPAGTVAAKKKNRR